MSDREPLTRQQVEALACSGIMSFRDGRFLAADLLAAMQLLEKLVCYPHNPIRRPAAEEAACARLAAFNRKAGGGG